MISPRPVLGGPEDISAVYALNRECFAEAWSRDGLQSSLGAGFELLVVRWQGELCAYLLSYDICDEVHIMQMAVARRWRRRGMGRALLRSLRERKSDMRSIELEVRASNQAAQALYRGMGFFECGRRRNYYSATSSMPAEDALLMRLILCPNGGGDDD